MKDKKNTLNTEWKQYNKHLKIGNEMKLVLVHLGNELKLRNGTSFIEAMLELLKQQSNREGQYGIKVEVYYIVLYE